MDKNPDQPVVTSWNDNYSLKNLCLDLFTIFFDHAACWPCVYDG